MIAWLLLACGPSEPLAPAEASFEPDLVCDPDAPATVGEAPLRRLTRVQYANTVRDWFGVDIDVPSMLDPDERIGTFASNLTVPVSQVTVTQYQAAAEAVAREVDVAAGCNVLLDDARTCAEDFVHTWLGRLGRRPVTRAEEADYLAIYDAFADDGHAAAMRVVLQAMLQSPWFLYRHELPTDADAVGLLRPLDGYAVASRLAFFLWAAGPDDPLLERAARGELDTAEGVRAAAVDLLADPRAARGLGQLHLEWLGVDRLDEVEKDPARFPGHDQAARDAMVADVVDYVDAIVRHGDGSWRSLLTAPHDIGDVEGEPSRTGLLTLPAVLTVHAHYQRSSLSLRGRVVREELLCQPLPDPPPDVDLSLPDIAEGGSTREVVEAHLADPSCAGCHELIDPIGFAFEPWDAVGRHRQTDLGHAIDPSGTLTGTDVDGDFADADDLARRLAESRQVEWCVTRQWTRYALGRPEREEDGCSLDAAWSAMQQPADLRELILAIVTSDAFRMQRTP